MISTGRTSTGTTSTPPRFLVFVGPSGSGKSAIVRSLSERGVVRVHPTWTTRPRRTDEDGPEVEHQFVSEPEFLRRRAAGFFLHSVSMFGLPHWYGLPAIRWSDRPVVDAVMLRAALVPILRSVYPDFVIYQIDGPRELVGSRLASRGCADTELEARLLDNEHELVTGRRVADRQFHNDRALAAVVDDIERAVRADFAPSLQETS
jgi:guanylate kinase